MFLVLGLNDHIQPTVKLITGLNKTIINTRGQISLPVTIGNCTHAHIFVICDKVDNDFY